MRTAVYLVAIFLLIGFALVGAAQKQSLNNPSIKKSGNAVRPPLITPDHGGESLDVKRFKRHRGPENHQQALPTSKAVERFQEFLNNCKGQCAEKMGFAPNEVEKSFLYEENPTPKEKCLMACVLEKTKIMNSHYKVSLDTIGNIAAMISKNELVVAIAKATAEHCNRHINSSDKCEAAAQINRCVAGGLKAHRIKIIY